jgi:hypothetical protein
VNRIKFNEVIKRCEEVASKGPVTSPCGIKIVIEDDKGFKTYCVSIEEGTTYELSPSNNSLWVNVESRDGSFSGVRLDDKAFGDEADVVLDKLLDRMQSATWPA